MLHSTIYYKRRLQFLNSSLYVAKIRGGQLAEIDEFPWMAMLLYERGKFQGLISVCLCVYYLPKKKIMKPSNLRCSLSPRSGRQQRTDPGMRGSTDKSHVRDHRRALCDREELSANQGPAVSCELVPSILLNAHRPASHPLSLQ